MTDAIAEAAGNSFFVARILAATQTSRPAVPDPADPAWRATLPKSAGPAMRQDLETRLGDQAARALDLLRPLAYAQGIGLPWEDVWVLLANALASGRAYTNEDLLWLAGHAGSFIVESGTIADRSAYRLYHRSLAEHLVAGRDQAADQHAITAALAAHVPLRFNGRPDWPASHPYIRAHLATHAADLHERAADGLKPVEQAWPEADGPRIIAMARRDPRSQTVSLALDATTASIVMFAVAAHADEREAHIREIEQYGQSLPEGSYGRRNRQAIAVRETRVTTRLRAVEHAYRMATDREAAVRPPEPTRTLHSPQHAADREMELE